MKNKKFNILNDLLDECKKLKSKCEVFATNKDDIEVAEQMTKILNYEIDKSRGHFDEK